MATAAKERARAELPAAIRELVRCFNERNLLTWAAALSFQISRSLVPFLLFSLGLIGFLHIDSAWSDLAKNLKPHMSKAAFTVVDDTAKKVVTEKQLWWVTIGFALAIWEFSGGIRSIMGGLNDIYELEEQRTWFERVGRSILIALVVATLVLLAVAVTWFGPLVYGDVSQPISAVLFVLRWGVAAVLLAVATG